MHSNVLTSYHTNQLLTELLQLGAQFGIYGFNCFNTANDDICDSNDKFFSSFGSKH
jgi:hypothetical protein